MILLILMLFVAADLPTNFRPAEGTKPEIAELSRWWKGFQDPELDVLVEQGIANNLDLKIAQSRLEQARALRRVVGAGELPAANAGGSAARTRTGVAFGQVVGRESGAFQSGLDASWELDFFHARRNASKAATEEIGVETERRHDTLLVLLSEISLNYMEMRGLENRLSIANRNTELQRDALYLTKVRAAAGLAPDLDVERQAELLASTEATIPALEADRNHAIQRLKVLAGGTFEPKGGSLPGPPRAIPTGLPSDLLKRRPDMRQAEAEIAAQAARVNVARADLWPKFNLIGNLGRQSTGVSGFTLGGGNFFAFGPSVSLPIFSGGRIKGNIAVEQARWNEARVRYEAKLLAALEDVDVALYDYDREQERVRRLERSVEAARESVKLATELYGRGLSDFLAVLDTQRRQLETEDSLEQSRTRRATASVRLYKALGGGWDF